MVDKHNYDSYVIPTLFLLTPELFRDRIARINYAVCVIVAHYPKLPDSAGGGVFNVHTWNTF
jgi:hypothetical protein